MNAWRGRGDAHEFESAGVDEVAQGLERPWIRRFESRIEVIHGTSHEKGRHVIPAAGPEPRHHDTRLAGYLRSRRRGQGERLRVGPCFGTSRAIRPRRAPLPSRPPKAGMRRAPGSTICRRPLRIGRVAAFESNSVCHCVRSHEDIHVRITRTGSNLGQRRISNTTSTPMSAVNWAAVSAKATARISSTTTTIRRPSGSTVGSVVPLVVSVVVSVVSPAATDDAEPGGRTRVLDGISRRTCAHDERSGNNDGGGAIHRVECICVLDPRMSASQSLYHHRTYVRSGC